jgi:hypothetical protein
LSVAAEPLQRLGNQLRQLSIRSTVGGSAGGSEHRVELGDEAVEADRALDQVQRRHPGVFVDHRGDLDRPAVNAGVEPEIDRPHHLRGASGNTRPSPQVGEISLRTQFVVGANSPGFAAYTVDESVIELRDRVDRKVITLEQGGQ